MKFLILGSTGHTGRAVTTEAARRGHDVTLLVRDPARAADLPADRIITGDATNPNDLTEALPEHDAVISCLGVGGRGDGTPTTLVHDATRALIAAMRKTGVERLVMMSNIGAGNSGDPLTRRVIYPRLLDWILPIIDDKNDAEALLFNATDIDWTALRFPHIGNGPKHPIRTTRHGRMLQTYISTRTAATTLLDAAETRGDPDNRTPSVSL